LSRKERRLNTYVVVYDLITGELLMASICILVDDYLGTGMFDETASMRVQAATLEEAIEKTPWETVLADIESEDY